MDFITYNDIELEVVRTIEVRRTVMRDPSKTDGIFTHWRIEVEALVNPQATSYRMLGDLPNKNSGQTPATTDAAIRSALLAPRKRLLVKENNVEIIRCPEDHFDVDANNGPKPELFSVVEVHGVKTYKVRWAVDAWVNSNSSANAPALVSNRWTREEDVDRDGIVTLKTDGVAIFRTDVLQLQQANADSVRRLLMQRIPRTFQRVKVKVKLLADGKTLRYSTIDQQLPYEIGGSGITQIKASQTYLHEQGGMTRLANNALWDAFHNLPHHIDRVVSLDIFGALSDGWRGWVGVVKNGIPKYGTSVSVEVYGNRGSNRNKLKNIAFGIASSRVGGQNLAGIAGLLGDKNVSIFCYEDLTSDYVQVIITLAWNDEVFMPIQAHPGNLLFGLFGPPGTRAFDEMMSQGSTISLPPWAGVGTVISRDLGGCPVPVGDGISRGSWLEELVAQALYDQGDEVPNP